jgi:hypothetical protein
MPLMGLENSIPYWDDRQGIRMIKYALICDAAHEFDSWFRDSMAFEKQAKLGLVTCPVCQSAHVSKAIMAPRIGRSGAAVPEPAALEPPASAPAPQQVALLDEREKMLRSTIRRLRQMIEANTDDVGPEFSEKARKMHHGEIPARSIRGQASLEEARALLEEGVEVMPVPMLPDERN